MTETSLFLIGDLPGFTPQIARLVSMMNYARHTTVQAVAGLGVDELDYLHGLNGHTPIFHTVNSAWNRSAPIMNLLLDAGGSPDVRVNGITWGKGMEWETICFDVTPVSYAQMGLLPQVHREERDIYANIARLLAAAGRPLPPFDNVPNKYLKG